MQTWMGKIKVDIAERAARREIEDTSERDMFKLRTTPVIERLRRFIESMPDGERNAPRSLEFYRQMLKAKYHGKHAHSGETGEALRALGYIRKRGWSSTEGGFRAVWYPPARRETV
jgi:hypothetical protein